MGHCQGFFDETARIAESLDREKVERMVGELVALRARRGRLFLLGVGGSAANCSHAVNDFRKLCGIEAYTPVDNVTTPSDDPRSYHINSDKIRRLLGYGPRRGIRDAVRDLCAAFKDGRLPDSFDDDRYFNVRTMKAIEAA